MSDGRFDQMKQEIERLKKKLADQDRPKKKLADQDSPPAQKKVLKVIYKNKRSKSNKMA